jgi:hypothetical protein
VILVELSGTQKEYVEELMSLKQTVRANIEQIYTGEYISLISVTD